MYELYTNEGIFLMENKPTQEQMKRYILAKRRQGCPLDEVIFCHRAKRLIHDCEFLILSQEEKAETELAKLKFMLNYPAQD